eukprot:TRINITY_DN36957_c0_g1_i1.p1 TRINITY_DN36957_c0_g1~~TRINITY_DN36957_c0_g1_i1.p1  ORF type:complete len:171 (-),score=58.14 TRINITY_DN36957_c0_g1_i1:65-577(-)
MAQPVMAFGAATFEGSKLSRSEARKKAEEEAAIAASAAQAWRLGLKTKAQVDGSDEEVDPEQDPVKALEIFNKKQARARSRSRERKAAVDRLAKSATAGLTPAAEGGEEGEKPKISKMEEAKRLQQKEKEKAAKKKAEAEAAKKEKEMAKKMQKLDKELSGDAKPKMKRY